MILTKEEALFELIRRDSYASMKFLGGFDHVPLHQEWHWLLLNIPEFMLLAPRGHAKTENQIYFIAWLIGRTRGNVSIKLFCCNGRESAKRMLAIGQIMKTAKYRMLFPWIKPDNNNWNKTSLRVISDDVTKDPQLEGLGFESSWTGSRAEWVFCDDVVDFESSLSMDTQDDYEAKYDSDLDNIRVPNSHLCYIATPWTITDLTIRLKDPTVGNNIGRKPLPVYQWDYMNYEQDGKLLWDTYWTKEAIEKKRENPHAWKQGFKLIPLTSDLKRIFFREYFEFIEPLKLDGKRPSFAIDLATGTDKNKIRKSKNKKCNSSIAIGYDLKDYKYFHEIIIMDLRIKDLLEKVEILDNRFNPHKIYFESNAFQDVFGDLLPDKLRFKSEGSPTTQSRKESVETGLEAFSGQIENRKVKFNKYISEDVIKEFIQYPFGKNDDSVMSSWMLWENMCNFIERVCL